MGLAVALIDVVYASLGLLGIGRLLNGGTVAVTLGLLSAAILAVIGARTAWVGLHSRLGLEPARDVVLPRRAFVTAIAATALNPLTIALWTVSFPAAAPNGSATLVAGVALGTSTWYCGFSTVVALLRRRIGERLLRLVDVATGFGLIAFGGVLGYRSVARS
jgi:threonine/homoserine/homoserine lactone efflux protein